MTPSARLERARRVADLLDAAFTLPILGDIGLDGLIGLLPVLGDWAMALPSVYVVYQGYRLGLPKHIVIWMLVLVFVDTVVGTVPVIGDLIDIRWKANQRNVARIERHVGAD